MPGQIAMRTDRAGHSRLRPRLLQLAFACAVALVLLAVPAAAASASTMSGRAFDDPGRSGVYQAGDTALANQQIYLFDGSGSYVGQAYTAADGTYSFTNLADGAYQVTYASPSWWALRANWVPDTTGSVRPVVNVQLTGSAEVDFGWRAIARSTNLAAPISEVVGPNGLTVESYDDVISAQTIYDTLMTGTIGSEARSVTVRFDWNTGSSSTTTSVNYSNGMYSGYAAISYVTYDSWLDTGDATLAHEYGHAWGSYYAYMVQQDPTLQAYLTARGLWGNPNLNSSLSWNQWELLADDYRQLLGPPDARSYTPMNGSIPAAAQVSGLGNFLANVFTQGAPPTNTAAPSLSGSAAVGQTLTCNPGSWTGSPTFTYRWSRDGSPIAGATARTYAATYGDGGHALSCTVTATSASGSGTAATPAVTLVALALSAVSISPAPVKTSGKVAFTLSAPASVTAQILNSSGAVVGTVISQAAEPAGPSGATWSRPKNVKAGTYTLRIVASAGGGSATSSSSFSVI
jgi:hypothetical protein